MKNNNRFKTADIRLHKDSQDCYQAVHKYQGELYESAYFETRNEARREAVRLLMELKDEDNYFYGPSDEVEEKLTTKKPIIKKPIKVTYFY